jgi:formyltetrahydrofolate-dependent phosphoribosylglycinamide formyltransferase
MFDGLKKKWKVGGLQFFLIICSFAIGGSLTGFLGKKIMNLTGIAHDWQWSIIYLLVILLMWPAVVIAISFPFGQFHFFTRYVGRIFSRIFFPKNSKLPRTGEKKAMVHIAIFASGAGSNAEKIIRHFKESKQVNIALVVCNKPGAGVTAIAAREGIPVLLIEKERFFRGDGYTEVLQVHEIDLVVLAGFLWKIPATLLKAFPKRVVNIHPALLPSYGGKGMYGNYVHAAVIAAGDKESGITIHYVDEIYDHGEIIFQQRCALPENATPSTLAACIHQFEHEHYAAVIEKIAGEIISARE